MLPFRKNDLVLHGFFRKEGKITAGERRGKPAIDYSKRYERKKAYLHSIVRKNFNFLFSFLFSGSSIFKEGEKRPI